MKTGDKALLCIGSDSYDVTVIKVSNSWIVYISDRSVWNSNYKRFKHKKGNMYYGVWRDNCFVLYDNSDGKLKAHLNESF